GACGGERAERERKSNERDTLRNSIPQLRKAISDLENGSQQQSYVTQNQRIENISKEIIQLKADKVKAMQLRDMWRDNPEVAAATGLGSWFGRLWERTVSCAHYERDIKDIEREMVSLNHERGRLQSSLEAIEKRLSPEAMQRIANTVNKLETEKQQLVAEIGSYNAEIQNLKNARATRIEAERLALEQEKQKREQQAAAGNTPAKAGDNTLLIAAVALFGGYLLFGNKKNVVKVKA
ncbi:hypothetical protein, partial [Capnocytophaga sp.]|uniref:hypothetical protein n=1 Tax=Capnocytophaga sp. TaxID=44737 RepID=UPI0026DB428E